jgi:RNase P subunit RPR2
MIKELKNIKARLGENPELKPVFIGMLNFVAKNKTAIDLAKKRFENHCKNCEFFVEESNELLKVEDKDVPELSNKMCADCGCVLSYKNRQSLKICEKWQK